MQTQCKASRLPEPSPDFPPPYIRNAPERSGCSGHVFQASSRWVRDTLVRSDPHRGLHWIFLDLRRVYTSVDVATCGLWV